MVIGDVATGAMGDDSVILSRYIASNPSVLQKGHSDADLGDFT